jgi:hypothetical protein
MDLGTAHGAVGSPVLRCSPFEDRTGVLQYAPLAHPEVALASGKLLVSISRNTTDLARLVRDPHIGRPVFVEIAMP